MNQQNAREFLPLVQALANGKMIQYNDGGDWLDVEDLNTDSYDPDEYRIKPEPRTFEMWLYPSTGRMYPVVDDLAIGETGEWELITVQEVLQ